MCGVNAEGGSPSKRQRLLASERMRSFVQSAGKYYREWEAADNVRVEKGCDVPLLKLSADPLFNYVGETLLWV